MHSNAEQIKGHAEGTNHPQLLTVREIEHFELRVGHLQQIAHSEGFNQLSWSTAAHTAQRSQFLSFMLVNSSTHGTVI